MISGKDWEDCPFLKESVEECKKYALEDTGFFDTTYDQSFKNCMRRKLREWTWIKEEQENLLKEIMEE